VSNQRTVFFNGDFIPEQDARLHVSDLSIQRGYGVFDFFKVIDDVPILMEDHLDRFFCSAAGLGLTVDIEKERIRLLVRELIDRNKMGFSGIKLTLTGGYSPGGYEIISPIFFITQHTLQPRPAEMVEQGIRLMTHEHMRELPQVKSINYITGLMLQKKLAAAGVSDVLYHKNNEVTELPRSTFFIVTHDNVIATPTKNILAGVTRKKVLELAGQRYQTAETAITLNDIRNAREAFITSTSRQVQPVVQIDGMIIGNGKPGPIAKDLDAQLQEVIESLSH
jgi:branched-chain amino acid aminotransferase